MLKIHDDVFDKEWIDYLSNQLITQPWYCDNVANKISWPNGTKGSHLLLGNLYYKVKKTEIIQNTRYKNFTEDLIKSFSGIAERVKSTMKLLEISSNLQFKGMDGTLHKDGTKNQRVFILMLCNEYLTKDIGGKFYHKPTNTYVKFHHGRLVEQNGLDLHKGLSFNKPHVARMSIKFVGENV